MKSRTAMAALEEACKGSVMVGKFPACVLHIQISCEAVDVNVHPAKSRCASSMNALYSTPYITR